MLKTQNVSVSKHLRREKRRAWICPPAWKFDSIGSLLVIHYALPPHSPEAALRVAESVSTAKILKKNLNYLNIFLCSNLQKIFWSNVITSSNFANKSIQKKFLTYLKFSSNSKKLKLWKIKSKKWYEINTE